MTNHTTNYSDHHLPPTQPKLKTPPGYNKRLRNICKVLLVGTNISLLLGNSGGMLTQIIGIFTSATAFIVIKRGTPESVKNWKWGILSIICFIASLLSCCLLEIQTYIDEQRSYDFKTKLWFYGTFIRIVTGGILSLFLISDFVTLFDTPPTTTTTTNDQQQQQKQQ